MKASAICPALQSILLSSQQQRAAASDSPCEDGTGVDHRSLRGGHARA